MKKLLFVLALALSGTANADLNDFYIVDMLCRSKADDATFAYRQKQALADFGPKGSISRENLIESYVTNAPYSDKIKEDKMHEISLFAINYAFDKATSMKDAEMATYTKCMDIFKLYR